MLRNKVNQYVEDKRAIGFKFRIQNSLLQNYTDYAEQCGDSYVRSRTVLEWANMAPSPEQKRNRLLTIRRFSIAIQAEDSRYEIPPAEVFGHQSAKRKIRRLFSSDDIRLLLAAASQLKPQGTMRPRTYSTLFALLAATGMRICEAIALNIEDVTDDGLTIKSTKYRKDRLVPLHITSQLAIKQYLKFRLKTSSCEPALFISNEGKRLPYSTVNSVFLQLMRSTGLRGVLGEPGACIHDLRHSFTVRSLEQLVGSHTEISRHMLALSTYLGHAHVSDTYWYMQATPALLSQIANAQATYFRRN